MLVNNAAYFGKVQNDFHYPYRHSDLLPECDLACHTLNSSKSNDDRLCANKQIVGSNYYNMNGDHRYTTSSGINVISTHLESNAGNMMLQVELSRFSRHQTILQIHWATVSGGLQ